jgi:hypothetical protein
MVPQAVPAAVRAGRQLVVGVDDQALQSAQKS